MRSLFANLKMEKGVTTLTAAMIVALVGIVLAGIVPMLSQSARANISNKDQIQAMYAAESGIKRAMNELKNKPDIDSWSNEENIWLKKNAKNYLTDGVRYEVQIHRQGISGNQYTYKIESRGIVESTFGTESKSEKMAILVVIKNDDNSADEVFGKYTLYGNGHVILTGAAGSMVYGDIVANTNYTLSGYTRIVGDIYIYNNATGKYNTIKEMPKLTVNIPGIPSWESTGYTEAPKIKGDNVNLFGDISLSGNYKTSNAQNLYNMNAVLSGNTNLYINGQSGFNMNNQSSINGQNHELTLVVDGNVTLTDDSYIKAKKLRIYATGDVILTSRAALKGDDVFISAGGKFKFTDSSNGINPDFFTVENYDMNNSSVRVYATEIDITNGRNINGNKIVLHAKNRLSFNGDVGINRGLEQYLQKNPSYQTEAEIYSNQHLSFQNACLVNASDCRIQSGDSMELRGDVKVNAYRNIAYPVVTQIYSGNQLVIQGYNKFEITDSVKDSRNDAIIKAENLINLSGEIYAKNTLVVGNQNIVSSYGNMNLAAIYSNGFMEINNWNVLMINEDYRKGGIIKTLANYLSSGVAGENEVIIKEWK